MSEMSDFVQDYVNRCIDDKIIEAWKNCPNYTGFMGSTGSPGPAYGPLVKGIRKIFEDAYVPMKEKTFLEQVVEIEDEN